MIQYPTSGHGITLHLSTYELLEAGQGYRFPTNGISMHRLERQVQITSLKKYPHISLQ